ncbi:NAD(P)H-quinone oxidoreductase subunit U, chloroplastic [Linum grandiflorum]
MAATPTAALHIWGPSLHRSASTPNSADCLTITSSKSKPRRHHRIVLTRIAADGPSSSSAATEVEEGGDWEGSIEAPQGPPSLISALNVERAFRGLPITEVDYYAVLELPRGCSYEEVEIGYKKKVEEVLNRGLEEEELSKELGMVKESYAILSSVEERRLYDWSLARTDNPPRYSWPSQADITQLESPETPPDLQLPEDEGAARAVGYFFIGWFVLSAVFSIALSQ